MSERCNVLRTITAALCCFYQKSSILGAKLDTLLRRSRKASWERLFVHRGTATASLIGIRSLCSQHATWRERIAVEGPSKEACASCELPPWNLGLSAARRGATLGGNRQNVPTSTAPSCVNVGFPTVPFPGDLPGHEWQLQILSSEE
ncbi:hypothetical protein Z043_101309 [Scleropages formosus]|uniref:Uncharacterized protein n=1 Tax=Scleropages formosus TaxID=113540 RepID=A0A0N8K2Z8_SCLFO|nr:hypothetical protein Z043_101309 [Scleropages formosus]